MRILSLFVTLIMSFPVSSEPFEGDLSLYFFDDGEPVSEMMFMIDDTQYFTDEKGGARFSLPAGQHLARFSFKNKVPKVWKFNLQDEEKILLIGSVVDDEKIIQLDIESSHVEQNVTTQKSKSDRTTGPRGTVMGKVISIVNNTPVPGVRIYVSGVKGANETDENGEYRVDIPAGETSLSFVHTDFSAQTHRSIDVNLMEELTLDIELTPLGVELSEVLIAAPSLEGGFTALVDEQKNTSNVAEVIGADQISNSGDSNAAGALKRVTGLSVVDGKYIYVRGLGERYSSVTLNGAGLPSPDPTRKVVPLDLIPAGVLESVVIKKTYAPDMPGDFGGGLVELRTKGLPEEKKRKISISMGGNSNSTFRQGTTYEGSSMDSLGFDAGDRQIPEALKFLTEGDKKSLSRLSTESLEAVSRSIPNQYQKTNIRMMPDIGLKASMGDRFESYDDSRGWGYQFSIAYKNKWRYREEQSEKFDSDGAGGFIGSDRSNREKTENDISLGGMLTVALEMGDENKISSTTLVTRSSSDTTIIDDAYLSDNDIIVRDTIFEWVERQLVTQQFSGRHELYDLYDIRVDWVAAYSLSSRKSPFTRIYRYKRQDDGEYLFSPDNDSNEFSYQNLNDNSINIGSDFTLPIYDFFDRQAKLKSGFSFEAKNRKSHILRYRFSTDWSRNSIDDAILSQQSPENILTPENISREGYLLSDNTSPTDNYEAKQTILSTYLMGELVATKNIKLMSGLRWEVANQEVSTFKLLSPSQKDTVVLSKSNILPAFSATWLFREKQQLRFALSQTLNRPDFKELSEAPYIDPETRDLVRGNKALKSATINHVDLRWEWYLTRFETFSVAGFYKAIDSPIERVIRLGGGGVQTFSNADSAKIYGAEMQGRFWVSRFLGRRFSRFYVESNVSLIKSSVDLGIAGSQQTTNNRPLQGQSPWLINFTLAYENLIAKIKSSLLLNISGQRLSSVGVNPIPDSYEQPAAKVDFVYSQEIYEGGEDKIKFKFKLNNILNPEYLVLQGEEVAKRYKKGVSGTVTLEYKWR